MNVDMKLGVADYAMLTTPWFKYILREGSFPALHRRVLESTMATMLTMVLAVAMAGLGMVTSAPLLSWYNPWFYSNSILQQNNSKVGLNTKLVPGRWESMFRKIIPLGKNKTNKTGQNCQVPLK